MCYCSEEEIIAGLEKGEERAVEITIDRYGDRMFRTALAITGDTREAEEVVQDAFLQVCRKIRSFKQQSSLQTWIYRITVNLAKNRLRSFWFKKVAPWTDSEKNLLAADDGLDPEETLLRREKHKEVLDCLKRLPLKYREALALFYLEELSITEIAQVLQQPAGTVKSKIFRARSLLEKELKAGEVIFYEA